ncbi:N,N-dimethylformamidase beta subunit family domain-containing protein [Streptomyces sp. NPDC005953]|uniref:N,N-dimethylformamidase beta subunit family domain-containing protein n=1 Tax=Streptomyces sp. NPDC005953 TaxID=3156719 RepID=UPI0033C08C17
MLKLLGLLGVSTTAVAFGYRQDLTPGAPQRFARDSLNDRPFEPQISLPSRSVREENGHSGSDRWLSDPRAPLTSSDRVRQIQGYASATSIGQGDVIDFHVSARSSRTFRISIFRLGHYGGKGARLRLTSPVLQVRDHRTPDADPDTGSIACEWPASWSLRIPFGWMSGLYQAVFTADDGFRAATPFVVKEAERASDLLVVLPFTTYQASNMWPKDRRNGKSLYRGYRADGTIGGADSRAYEVSFDRPYSGAGIPSWFHLDTSFIDWAERSGLDVTYASSLDLHDGTVDTTRYRAVFFPGHDAYWSADMLDSARKSVAAGTHLAFLTSHNVYFHVRLKPAPSRRTERTAGTAGTRPTARTMACYKSKSDPAPDRAGRTSRWREVEPGQRRAEQGLLGIQFNGIVAKPVALVVKESGHWLWAGSGVRDGDELPGLVGVEADRLDPTAPTPVGSRLTLLAESPYHDPRPVTVPAVQHTAITEYRNGALVFVAGTFHWPLALTAPEHLNEKIQKATGNLVARMVREQP